MIRTATFLVRGLAVAALPLTSPVAWAQTAPAIKTTVTAGQTDVVLAPVKRADRLIVAQAGSPAPPPGPPPHFGLGAGPPPPFGGKPKPDRHPLARELATMETEIGIRSNQVDAWRDFTDSILSVTAPSAPPKPPLAVKDGAPSPKREPFALVEELANHTVERGLNAERLIKAIDVLRGVLTPQQLEKVSALEGLFMPPLGGLRPPPHHPSGKPGSHPDGEPGPDHHGTFPTFPLH